jgi:hypothetical protein
MVRVGTMRKEGMTERGVVVAKVMAILVKIMVARMMVETPVPTPAPDPDLATKTGAQMAVVVPVTTEVVMMEARETVVEAAVAAERAMVTMAQVQGHHQELAMKAHLRLLLQAARVQSMQLESSR